MFFHLLRLLYALTWLLIFYKAGAPSVLHTLTLVSVNWCSKNKEPHGQENSGKCPDTKSYPWKVTILISILKALKGPAVRKKPL